MNGPRRPKPRLKRPAPTPPPPRTAPAGRRLHLGLDALEIARGHDGLLRGDPEPCLVVGAYLVEAGAPVVTLTRVVLRVRPELQRWPGRRRSARADRPVEPLCAHPLPRPDPPTEAGVVVLVVALEEDGPAAIERVYGLLERAQELAVWPERDAVPEPVALSALGSREPLRVLAGEGVRVQVGGHDLAEGLGEGDWVGASLVRLRASPRPAELVRCHLTDHGSLNDWTALLAVSIEG